jgi:cyclopropane-fatty-acyl-phospholipid synthase
VTELLRLPAPPARDGGRRAKLHGKRHTMQRDRDAVQFHYDLGNDFFRQFLDEDLVYSCAYFDDGWEDDPAPHLEAAQRRKLDMVCRKLDLRPGESLLDVGCGWGSLVLHAAREYDVRAVGVTLSSAQAQLARERVGRAGLADRVTILEQDYREVTGRFDAVASVGMVEHVGSDHLPTYFSRLRELVGDGGRLLNHGITTGQRQQARDMRDDEDSFVAHYVFPDGGLVPAWRTVREVERAGFEVHDVHQLRRHYALTLRSWIQRLEANRDEAVAASSEIDYRIWRAYMAGSVVGFETNDLGVVQVLAGAGWDAPLDRSHMHPTDRPATAS